MTTEREAMTEEMRFDDVLPIRVDIWLNEVKHYLLEATGDPIVRYRAACMSAVRMVDGKMSGVDGKIADTEAMLVAACLWRCGVENLADQPVRLDEVRKLPGRIQTALFVRCQKICSLTGDDSLDSLRKRRAVMQRELAEVENKILDLESPEHAARAEEQEKN